MAKSLLTALVQTGRAMERERKRQERISSREYATALRKFQQAQKAEERAILKMEKAAIAERKSLDRAATANRKAMEKAAKIAHIETMKATAEEQNFELATIYDDIHGLLEYTLNIDDYVDLETLRRTNKNLLFDPGNLAVSHTKFTPLKNPEEPKFKEPPKPKGFFGKKKKLAIATEEATTEYNEAHSSWKIKVKQIEIENKQKSDLYIFREKERLKKLEESKKRFQKEVIEHNKEVMVHNERLDNLINGLGYGTVEAIEEYISIVVSNSVYPEHFQVSHSFTFDPAIAELNMIVSIPPPSEVENIKAYKYKQSTDEIGSTLLSMKAQKDRYSGAVYQIAIRSFHEVFEADRRGLIKTISLEVGTEHTIPSTGRNGFIPFVAAAADRDTFLEFELSGIVPLATLKHIGAAISKNPFELIAVDTTGVRRS